MYMYNRIDYTLYSHHIGDRRGLEGAVFYRLSGPRCKIKALDSTKDHTDTPWTRLPSWTFFFCAYL
jgi:hypothetical protein